MAPRCGPPSCLGKLQKLSHAPRQTELKGWSDSFVELCVWGRWESVLQMVKYADSISATFSDLAPEFPSPQILCLMVFFTLILAHHICHYYCESCSSARAFNLVKVDKILALCCLFPLFDWCVKWWPGVSFVYTLTAVAWL